MTSELNIIKELNQDGLQAVVERYKLNIHRHEKYPNLVLFKYDQIESPYRHPTIIECRGIILDENNHWSVVSRPYDRFFNYDEAGAAQIDWPSARVCEKTDGSLTTLYYYDSAWHVASSGKADASGLVEKVLPFKELFWNTFHDLGYRLPEQYTDYCFMFELCTVPNRIIVAHEKPRLVLHGVRNIKTQLEDVPDSYAEQYGWELVKYYNLNNMQEITKSLENTSPSKVEGYVVVDKFFNRIKIKSPQYVALSHLNDGISDHRLIEIMRNCEDSEFLSYFPKYRERFDILKAKYNNLLHRIEESYASAPQCVTQKEFAAYANKFP